MKKYLIISSLVVIVFGFAFWRVKNPAPKITPVPIDIQGQAIPATNDSPVSEPATIPPVQKTSTWLTPLDRAKERVTKKYFGIFITPATSPVQPERFRGYHTGTDFEIFPEELNAPVTVSAICSGKLAMKKYATGYGGVAVESCVLNDQPVTVVYGHLKLASISHGAGDDLKTGDTLGQLGIAYSTETSGERKHLHLGIHKGSAIDILGYVQTKSALADWIDPCSYVCQ